MQKCSYCGASLVENTRFCGKCGSVQDVIATHAATTSSNTPQSWAPEEDTISATRPNNSTYPAQGSTPVWSPNGRAPETPLPPSAAENEDERREGIAPWSSLYGAIYGAALGEAALLGSGQAYTPTAPVVQGTPQLGSAPSVAGSPSLHTHAPVAHPTTGAGNVAPVAHPAQGITHAPVAHPAQGSANATIGHPVQGPVKTPVSRPAQAPAKTPVSHPVQGPVKTPVSHPVQGPAKTPVSQRPQPTHQPPEQPGTQQQQPSHKPHRHHDHTAQHNLHRARVTKVAGGSTVKTIMIVVAAVVVVAAGGIAAAHSFLRPQPLISISSNYTVGNAPAGTIGTILHISGQHFASNSPVTFLLDGHAAPGNAGAQSDANGNVNADITITNAWSVGTHTLTAKDASNTSPKNGVSVTIVQPGQANTPGPNGAPPDDATFTLKVTIQVADPYVGEPFASNPVLIITGHPDPEGGTICSPDDSGQSFTYNAANPSNGIPYTETETASCTGTYKAGQISYIETDTSAKGIWQYNGLTINCVLNNPSVILQLTGAYTGNNTFSGTINYPYVPFTCDQQGYRFYQEALKGTWTGTVSGLQS